MSFETRVHWSSETTSRKAKAHCHAVWMPRVELSVSKSCWSDVAQGCEVAGKVLQKIVVQTPPLVVGKVVVGRGARHRESSIASPTEMFPGF